MQQERTDKGMPQSTNQRTELGKRHCTQPEAYQGTHRMGWRSQYNNYTRKGLYHITITVADRHLQVLSHIVGDPVVALRQPGLVRVQLTPLGAIVQHELMHGICTHYPMVRVDTFVIMPDHLHFILDVREKIVSANGRETHLGQVIAGFKKGCNRRYWALVAQGMQNEAERRGEPAAAEHTNMDTPDAATPPQAATSAAPTGATAATPPQAATSAAPTGATASTPPQAATAAAPTGATAATPPQAATSAAPTGATAATPPQAATSAATTGATASTPPQAATAIATPTPTAPTPAVISSSAGCVSLPAVLPQAKRAPSRGTTGRLPLFASGYVDVMPLEPGQLQVQREYIRNNPRSRLLRTANRQWLQPRRGGIDTALGPNALLGYLRRECAPAHITPEIWVALEQRLLKEEGRVGLDTYGNRALLARTLLPVCCHRRDKHLFQQQKARCIGAARGGAVLVSARIACGEQEIMDAAIAEGWPVVLVADNGLPPIYHPSADRTDLCAAGRLLIVSPWHYTYRRSDQSISEAECKAMNCVAQALCRLSDDWWEGEGKV